MREGEVFAFLGPNGAGKTTTLRMLTTLLSIDAGRAVVAGVDVAKDPALVRRQIGYVGQSGGADLPATGRENLLLQARLYGLGRAQAARRTGELIELLALSDFVDRLAHRYSGRQGNNGPCAARHRPHPRQPDAKQRTRDRHTMTLLDELRLLTWRKLLETLRQPAWLVMGLIAPLLYLVLFASLLHKLAGGPGFAHSTVLDVFLPGLLSLLAFGTGMGAGWGVISELDTGVIERLRVTPVSRFALPMGAVRCG